MARATTMNNWAVQFCYSAVFVFVKFIHVIIRSLHVGGTGVRLQMSLSYIYMDQMNIEYKYKHTHCYTNIYRTRTLLYSTCTLVIVLLLESASIYKYAGLKRPVLAGLVLQTQHVWSRFDSPIHLGLV